MGNTWQVELYCVTANADGREGWSWVTVYRGESLRQAVRVSRLKKKETDGAVRVTWR